MAKRSVIGASRESIAEMRMRSSSMELISYAAVKTNEDSAFCRALQRLTRLYGMGVIPDMALIET